MSDFYQRVNTNTKTNAISKDDWQRKKDYLHKRRLELVEKIKDGIMTKGEMNQGEEGHPEFNSKVQKYDRWSKAKGNDIREFQDICREFKKQGEEGRPVTLDNLRRDGEKLKFE